MEVDGQQRRDREFVEDDQRKIGWTASKRGYGQEDSEQRNDE